MSNYLHSSLVKIFLSHKDVALLRSDNLKSVFAVQRADIEMIYFVMTGMVMQLLLGSNTILFFSKIESRNLLDHLSN